MRAAKRKQRHQSEPLPPRERDSAEPPDELGPGRFKDESVHVHPDTLQDTSNTLNHAQRSSLDPQSRDTRDTASRGAVAFPLTPTSAVGEAERAMATVTPAITNDRCSPSDGLQAPELSASPVKMSQQPTINDALVFPPPPDVPVNNPSSANTVRAPPSHANGSASSSSSSRTMSHRGENLPIRPRHFQDHHFHDTGYHYSTHPSPPPIATLTHSPSLSSDRSSVSSPAPTILPPLTHPAQLQQQSYLTSSGHRYASAAQQAPYHHGHYYPGTVAPPDVFTPPTQSYVHSYGGSYAPPPPAHAPFHHTTDMSISSSQQYSGNPYATVPGAMYSHGGHSGGGSGGFTPIYTDDASTKLSDRVRRRCFNCCTTDTSTWRRSSLNPGKVLCNKCGLFERTHSRPRPDQFPHKRAPLQIPSHSPAHDSGMSAQSGNMEARQQMQSPHASTISAPHNLPPTTAHPSLGAAYSHPSALPQIQEWLRPNSGPATGGSPASSSASAVPSRAASASSAGDRHHHAAPAGNAPATSNTGASATSASTNASVPRSQGIGARLVKRSDSVNSDMLGTPPPQRVTQNLTPSPSPPPEGSRGGPGVGGTGSPRVQPAGIDTGSV